MMGTMLITRTVRNHHICNDHPPQRPAPQKWPRLCCVARNSFFASSIFNLTNRLTVLPDYVIGLSHYANARPESSWFYLSSMIAPWKMLYRLYARSVNNKHIMHIIAIAIPSSSYSKSSQNIRSPNYKDFTNPAPSARPILSINFSEIIRTQSVIWLKEHAKPKRNARSSAQWMNHTQRALSSSPSGECTPTHKPHCRVQDDGGTTSLASSPGEIDEHDWLLYYGDIFQGGISVILYSRVKIIMYFVYHSISLQKLIHHVGAHQYKDTAIKKFRLPQNVHHKGEQCLAPLSATVLIYHSPHTPSRMTIYGLGN